MMNTKFSVLMSLYIKEKSEYARACFEKLQNYKDGYCK